MEIFELEADPKRYCNFALADPVRDGGIYDSFNGMPLASRWSAPAVTPAHEEDNAAELGDYALLGTAPVFSLRALESLLDLLKPNGEMLPLRYRQAEYFAYNVTRVLPALDEDASVITRFPTGRVMSVNRYVFRPTVIGDVSVFKIPELARAYVFVTGDFVQRVLSRGLTGFCFLPLWIGTDW